MVALQRAAIGDGGIVVEGRDIGTVGRPARHVKVFLTASAEARAARRAAEHSDGGRAEPTTSTTSLRWRGVTRSTPRAGVAAARRPTTRSWSTPPTSPSTRSSTRVVALVRAAPPG